jgi:predicted amidophosphoribosyltransferase
MANCYRCGEIATDPGKGPSPWTRAVVAGEQVLVCPGCQHAYPAWIEDAESCPACGSKKLSKALGDRVCRTCTYQWNEEPFTLD